MLRKDDGDHGLTRFPVPLFSKTQVTLVVISPELQDGIYDLE